MFSLRNLSQISVNSFMRIRCESKSSINKTIIRLKRHVFHRRPVKVLTDSGEDYIKHYSYREPISSAEHEINLNDIKGDKSFNQYYDEGLGHEFDDQSKRDFKEFSRNRFRDRTFNNDNEFDGKIEDNDRVFANNMRSFAKKNEKPETKKERNEEQAKRSEERAKQKEKGSVKQKVLKELKPRLDGIPVYEKLGEDNKEFLSLMSNMKMRKRREKLNLMILEGKRLITDAINAGVKVKNIYFTKEETLVGIPNLMEMSSKGVPLKKVFYRDMKLFSEVVTCPGVMALCERPDKEFNLNPLYNERRLPLILIGDNIRDPGNLGTMIRTAAAVGIEKLILTKGCVDAWDSKVLRSGAGAHFRLPIISDVEWPLIFNHIPIDKPFDLFIAESNEDFDQKDINKLNKNSITETDIPLHTINTIKKEIDLETDEIVLCDDSYNETNDELIKYRSPSIESSIYSDTKFFALGTERPSVLVIGGETHGLSNQSYKFAYDYIGRRIKIPLAFGVDSLNSAVAAAVILYEMQRQFHLNCNTTNNQL